MCNSSTKFPLASECRKATPLPQATVAHRRGGFTESATVKTIPLSNSRLKAFVNDADYKKVCGRTWRARKSGRVIYAVASIRHRQVGMHKLILPGFRFIDHRDRNGLNNRRGNLRPCNQSQNGGNRAKNKRGTSRFKGVSWRKKDKCWSATIGFNYGQIRLGHFSNERDAARAYNAAARKLWGSFARINIL